MPQAKLTRSPIRIRFCLFSSLIHMHAFSFFFFLSFHLLPYLTPSPAPLLHFAFLSRSRLCRQGEQPRIVSALLSPASSYQVSARSLEFAEPLTKMTIFLGHRVTRTLMSVRPVLMRGVGSSRYFKESTQFG